LDTALADIIDNSIAAGSTKISVRFEWNNGDPWIAVLDNGCGMCTSALYEAMRLGSRSPNEIRHNDDLGRFGLGLKTASFSQCRRLTVVSKAFSKPSACCWDLDHLAHNEQENWEMLLLEPSDFDGALSELVHELEQIDSGTLVFWQNLDSALRDSDGNRSESQFASLMDRARSHVDLVFYRFIQEKARKRRLQIDFNGTALEGFDPFGPAVGARTELPLQEIRVEGSLVSVQPYVLPHHSKIPPQEYERFGGEEGYQQSQGFYVFRNKRLIVKATWFRLMRKEALTKLVRVRVDIPNTLDALWKIDVRKAEASPPESVLRELRHVINRIEGFGKRVYTQRSKVALRSEKKTVWLRVVSGGRIRYSINPEYPLVQSLLNDRQNSGKVRALLNLISNSFPTDVFYSDAACDQLDLTVKEDSEESHYAARTLAKALLEAGVHPDRLMDAIRQTELPGVTEGELVKIITEIISCQQLNA
jgi:hypothetical protein